MKAPLAQFAPKGRNSVARLPDNMVMALRAACTSRLATLRSYRIPWWSHWASLAEVYLPRRYRWFVTPNQFRRGSEMNQAIVDETGMLAARTLATGLLSGLTSPTKAWFKFGLFGQADIDEGPVKTWLADCTRITFDVLGGSNFYESQGTKFHDVAVFGSAAQIQLEDERDIVRFYNPCLGEFFFGLDNRLTVDTLYREYTYTVSETIKEFGMENVSPATAQMGKSASSLDTEIVIAHAIEPNDMVYWGGQPVGYPVPKMFPYREVYWEYNSAGGQQNAYVLRVKGFHEKPFVGNRWDVTSNDAYGRSPGMDGLPANLQLQIEQRRKAEGIDKMVRPPMVGSVALKNEPIDTLPGGVTFVPDPSAEGFKPAYTVQPQLQEMREDIMEVQDRLKKVFFVDLFQLISDLKTVRTATEIDARNQEKIILLGPVIERTETEDLDYLLKRTFAICSRRGLYPPPPPEIQGMQLNITYISMLAETQRGAATAALERIWQFAGGLVAVQPQIIDNLNGDKTIEHYGSLLNVPADVIRALKEVLAIRAQREQEQQAQAAIQVGTAAAQGAKTLSDADVGGGQNALQAMMGRAA